MNRRVIVLVLLASGCMSPSGAVSPPSKESDKGITEAGCKLIGLLDNGRCDVLCGSYDPVCKYASEHPLFAIDTPGEPLKLPIVLAHGMGGSASFLSFHSDIVDALRADGHVVYRAEVPPYASVETRAQALAAFVDATGEPRVHIVAHSMGGLDARYMISSLGYGDRVASLTTISAPHRGSLLADAVLPILAVGGEAAERFMNGLLELAGEQFSPLGEEADVRAVFEALSTERSIAFNRENPDDPLVYYQSYAGIGNLTGSRPDVLDSQEGNPCFGRTLLNPGTYGRISLLLVAKIPIISSFGDEPFHDALVSVDSSIWGDFRGCIPTDHALEIGGLFVPHVSLDPFTGFEPISFYRTIAFGLRDHDR